MRVLGSQTIRVALQSCTRRRFEQSLCLVGYLPLRSRGQILLVPQKLQGRSG